MKNNITVLCGSKGFRISELIKDTGLAKSYVYSILKGKSTPSIKTARIISSFLGASLEEVFPEEELESGDE